MLPGDPAGDHRFCLSRLTRDVEGPVNQVITGTSQEHIISVPNKARYDRLVKASVFAAVAVAAIIALLAAGVLFYGLRQGAVIYRGVSAAGVDLTGLSEAEARDRLTSAVAERLPAEIEFVAGERRHVVARDSLGVQVDVDATVQRAYDYGRSGNLWRDSRAWVAALLGGHELALDVRLDDPALVATLEEFAPAITRAPHDASFVADGSGSLTVQPGEEGIAINVPATAQQLRKRLGLLSTQPVPVVTVPVEPNVTAQELEAHRERAQAMVAEPLVLTLDGTARWAIDPATLQGMLTVRTVDGTPALELDAGLLGSYIASLADQVERPGQDATVVWSGERFTVQPATEGAALDVSATVAEINRVLAAGQHEVAVQTEPLPARIGDAAAQAAADEAMALVAQPLNVTWPDGSRDLTPAELASVIRFEPQAGATPQLVPVVDDDAVTTLLERIAPEIEVAARNADLRYLGGQVEVRRAEKVGRKLDVAASATALKQALSGGDRSAALATVPVEPEVTAALAGSIQIREELSSARTYYGGSVPNRKFNVELAVERVNGALVPPGGVFSFTETVGAVDLESGYKIGYGIVGTSNGSVSTVPSVGGGICQVSTTVFQAAFWAGMPIVERAWHLYWIPLYGQPPSGITGLDAAVDTDYGLDFKFKNTTDDWIAVVASADGEWVHFELRGTNPNWTVEVDDPVVTNVVKADTTMKYEESSQLPAGQSVFVESAQDGFDVMVHRRVRDAAGQLIDDLQLRSSYVPSSNVTLVGTG